MLELYDSKFILTTDDGKLINCYSDFGDARTDAKDVVKNQNIDNVFIYEQIELLKFGDDYLQKNYKLRERIGGEDPDKEEEGEGEMGTDEEKS